MLFKKISYSKYIEILRGFSISVLTLNIIDLFHPLSASKTGMVDTTPEAQKAVKDEIEKINKQYGSSASAEFPAISFAGMSDSILRWRLSSTKYKLTLKFPRSQTRIKR